MNRDDIINKISLARNNAKLSARALSQLIDMNENYINRLENKRDFLPSLEVFLKIIEACNLTPDQFFYYDMKAYNKDIEIIRLLKNTSEDKKNAIISLLQKDN
ncbi:MAG: helix-turn-helix transcriptional regulator [Clostridia bacterium]|nr:helix-turn-helix transcriptional regulator [Clostridia bacterium]